MTSFKPDRWLTFWSVGALIVLLALGSWQVQRLFWKRDLIATAEAHLSLPPAPLEPGMGEGKAWEYRRVLLNGRYAHDKELYLGVRYRKGKMGFNVLTPMQLADGRWILVNRGWITPELREQGGYEKPEGAVMVEALLRQPKGPGLFTPENETAKNYWFTVDPAQASEVTGLVLLPFYAEVTEQTEKGVYPEASPPKVDFLNDHLQYAVIWYALAVALVIFYVLYHRRRA